MAEPGFPDAINVLLGTICSILVCLLLLIITNHCALRIRRPGSRTLLL